MGYEDTNDADYLRHDPTMREVPGRMDGEKRAASSSETARLETQFLPHVMNLGALCALPGRWVGLVHRHVPIGQIVLDLDSSGSPTHGNQEGTEYNGYLGEECYHPLLCFNQFGDLEGAMLRPGNVHTAEDWDALLDLSACA